MIRASSRQFSSIASTCSSGTVNVFSKSAGPFASISCCYRKDIEGTTFSNLAIGMRFFLSSRRPRGADHDKANNGRGPGAAQRSEVPRYGPCLLTGLTFLLFQGPQPCHEQRALGIEGKLRNTRSAEGRRRGLETAVHRFHVAGQFLVLPCGVIAVTVIVVPFRREIESPCRAFGALRRKKQGEREQVLGHNGTIKIDYPAFVEGSCRGIKP